jgi:phenylalanyl-tRNA synthetase beta chain
LGSLGEIHPDVLENYNSDIRTYVADIDFNIILQLARLDKLYKPLPKYPAITRDIAVIVKDTVYSKEIENIIIQKGGELLEECRFFDVYKGRQIPKGYKSMAYSLTFRAGDRTLTDGEVGKVYDRILNELKERLDAELR